MMARLGLLNFFSLKKIYKELYHNENSSHKISQDEIEALQNCLTNIYRDIFNVCEKYHLHPFLQGGTLLGFVRHNGYIPWDDDLDLGLFRSEYEQLKKIFEKELDEQYLLKGPGCSKGATNRFIQIYKKDTYYKTMGMSDKIPHHIYIDIFPIDYAPNSKYLRTLKGIQCNLLMGITSCTEFKEMFTDELALIMKKTFVGRINMWFRLIAGTFFMSIYSLDEWYQKVDEALRGKFKSLYCTSGAGRKHYLGEVVKSDVFFPLKKVEFEGVPAWIPNQSELYLENLYGDYMRVPDEKDREQHFIEAMVVKYKK